MKETTEIENKNNSTTENDTYSYKGWLNSDFFAKRALAIYGYSIAASLIIFLILLVIFLALPLGAGFMHYLYS